MRAQPGSGPRSRLVLRQSWCSGQTARSVPGLRPPRLPGEGPAAVAPRSGRGSAPRARRQVPESGPHPLGGPRWRPAPCPARGPAQAARGAWPRPSRLRRESCCSTLRNAEPQRWRAEAAGGSQRRPARDRAGAARCKLGPVKTPGAARKAGPPQAQAGPRPGGDNHAARWCSAGLGWPGRLGRAVAEAGLRTEARTSH